MIVFPIKRYHLQFFNGILNKWRFLKSDIGYTSRLYVWKNINTMYITKGNDLKQSGDVLCWITRSLKNSFILSVFFSATTSVSVKHSKSDTKSLWSQAISIGSEKFRTVTDFPVLIFQIPKQLLDQLLWLSHRVSQ